MTQSHPLTRANRLTVAAGALMLWVMLAPWFWGYAGLSLALSPWLLGYATNHAAWVNELLTGLLLSTVGARAAGISGSMLARRRGKRRRPAGRGAMRTVGSRT